MSINLIQPDEIQDENDEMYKSKLIMEVILHAKRIYEETPNIIYYTLADGIYEILKKTYTGIKTFIPPLKKEQSQQISFFEFNQFKCCMDGGY